MKLISDYLKARISFLRETVYNYQSGKDYTLGRIEGALNALENIESMVNDLGDLEFKNADLQAQVYELEQERKVLRETIEWLKETAS